MRSTVHDSDRISDVKSEYLNDGTEDAYVLARLHSSCVEFTATATRSGILHNGVKHDLQRHALFFSVVQKEDGDIGVHVASSGKFKAINPCIISHLEQVVREVFLKC